ncbi:hypothetical protein JCM9157_3966 [Halalkalibacter akibai JCM 9157]|uniref:Uncharacterized protein n=1 Tax=Halalkalibacter akibai (strain ATCC 43226 / DSM 21942 / CIP 109018 / JCM 9157 / 1139) TaxID=1236973 RepID=W4QZK9_HALA3|nr:hypothetical protein JCM9157_3966 [Halalkalibacter akibai JCM 9157]
MEFSDTLTFIAPKIISLIVTWRKENRKVFYCTFLIQIGLLADPIFPFLIKGGETQSFLPHTKLSYDSHILSGVEDYGYVVEGKIQ